MSSSTSSTTGSAKSGWRLQAEQAGDITLDGMFRRAFSLFAQRTAVSWAEGQLSYAELGERAWRLANALQALGFGRGDTIAVLSETRPEYVECYAAMASLGITVATLNVRLHPDELAACLRKCKPVALLVSDTLAPVAQALRAQAPGIRHWIGFGQATPGLEDYKALLLASHPTEPPRVARGDDIHNILFTSGTTGQPKGALISQRAAATRGLRLAQWFGLTEKDGFIGWLPLFHCGGDESLYATICTGGTYATFRRSRSIRSSRPSASKPGSTTSVPPAATTGVQMALSCAVWNIGIMASTRSLAVSRLLKFARM